MTAITGRDHRLVASSAQMLSSDAIALAVKAEIERQQARRRSHTHARLHS